MPRGKLSENKAKSQIIGSICSMLMGIPIILTILKGIGIDVIILFIATVPFVAGIGILSGKRWGRILFWIVMPITFLFAMPFFENLNNRFLNVSYIAVAVFGAFMLSRPKTLLTLGLKKPGSFLSRVTLPFSVTLVMTFLDFIQSTNLPQFQYGNASEYFKKLEAHSAWMISFHISTATCIIATIVSSIPSRQKMS